MKKEFSDIALIYFSRNAEAESHEKKWLKESLSLNKSLAKSFISQSSKVVRNSGLPVYHYHEGNQLGNTFGEKLANAYEEVFSLGYQSVIAVGNDTPGLEKLNWKTTASQLKKGQNVIGPSLSGGAYFIGITRQSFQKEKFKNLSWQTEGLLEDLSAYCLQNLSSLHILEELLDINNLKDLKKAFTDSSISRYFKRNLKRLVDTFQIFISNFLYQGIKTRFKGLNLALRAPPIL